MNITAKLRARRGHKRNPQARTERVHLQHELLMASAHMHNARLRSPADL